MRRKITNATLATNLVGGGQAVTDLSGLEVGYKTVREVCIGIRTAGSRPTAPEGSGSWDDPYNVNTTAKFDARVLAAVTVPGTALRIRDGEFTTKSLHYGNRQIRPGVHILGEGGKSGRTIIKLDPDIATGISGSIFMVTGDASVNMNGARVEGIQFDCNSLNLLDAGASADIAICGIGLLGDNNVIKDCVVKNQYGKFMTGHESFGLVCDSNGTGGSNRNSKIIGSRVESPQGDYATGIIVAGPESTLHHAVAGVLRDCTVLGFAKPPGSVAGEGVMQAMGIDGGIAEGNTVIGAVVAFYVEQGRDLIVRGNFFLDCRQFGIHLNNTNDYGIADAKLFDNVIEMRDDNLYRIWGITYSGPNVVRAYASKNTLRLKTTGNAISWNPISFLVGSSGQRGHRIEDNAVDVQFTQANVPAAANVVVKGNRGLLNELLTTLPDGEVRSNHQNSALHGTLHNAATITAPNGYSLCTVESDVAYDLVDGDRLEFEMYSHPSNKACTLSMQLEFDDVTFSSGLMDQNGLLLAPSFPVLVGSDTTRFSRGRFYWSSSDLSQWAGQTVIKLFMINIAALAGTYRYYLRNVQIVSALGQRRAVFYTDDVRTNTRVSPSSSNDATGISCAPFYLT